MGEFSEALKIRYSKSKNTEVSEKLKRQRAKGSILNLCETYLQEEGDILTFEATKGELPYVVEALNDDIITSRYIVSQISENLFKASLVEVDLGLV